jgi:hypothetical protein
VFCFANIKVDASTHNAGSRFVDHPEGLEEELRHLRLNQEEVNKDFNQGQMYKDTATQNMPFCCLFTDEIALNWGDMSATGRQLYVD